MIQLIVDQILNGLIVGALYGIGALAVSLTFGITGIVNFALGAFMTLGAYFTWFLRSECGWPYPFAALAAVGAVGMVGLLTDLGLFRFTRNHLVNGLLVSIGLISVCEGALLFVWTSAPREMGAVLPGSWHFLGAQVPKENLLVFVALLVIILGSYLLFTRTWLGKAAFAFSQNPEAAELMGVPTSFLQSAVVVYSTMLAAAAGALYMVMYSIEPAMGTSYVLKAVEGAIIAGIGSTAGALLGGVMIGVTEGVASLFLPLALHDAYGLVLLVLVLMFRPSGLFASAGSARAQAVASGRAGLFARMRGWAVPRRWRKGLGACALSAALVLPLVVHGDAVRTICIYAMLLSGLAVSYNLIFGATGQLSLFHSASFGLAAYVTAILTMGHGWNFWMTLVPAVALVSVIALLVGMLCFGFKLRAFYFTVATMAAAELLRLLVVNWYDLTQGAMGMTTVITPGLPGLAIEGSVAWYYAALALLLVVLVVCRKVLASGAGRCLQAIRLNEQLAQSLGVNTFAYKLLAFVLASALAAVVGSFYAAYSGFVDPGYMSIARSLDIIAMVLLGGVGTLFGPIIGAFVLTSLPFLIHIDADLRVMLYGAILVAIIVLMPQGVLGFVRGGRDAV